MTIVPRLLAARGVAQPLGEVDVAGDARSGRVGRVLVDFPIALLEAAE